jgi:hypothetical protein
VNGWVPALLTGTTPDWPVGILYVYVVGDLIQSGWSTLCRRHSLAVVSLTRLRKKTRVSPNRDGGVARKTARKTLTCK